MPVSQLHSPAPTSEKGQASSRSSVPWRRRASGSNSSSKLFGEDLPECTTPHCCLLYQKFRSCPHSLKQQQAGLLRDQTASIIFEANRSLFVTLASGTCVKDRDCLQVHLLSCFSLNLKPQSLPEKPLSQAILSNTFVVAEDGALGQHPIQAW